MTAGASLGRASLGVGGLALASLAAGRPPAHAKAKRLIWLYMDGGMSHLDTFDPKPRLAADAGKPFPMPIEATQFDSKGPVLASPWKFDQHGQSGLPVSELFPHVAAFADDLAVVRSMTNESAIHATANYWMNTGWGQTGRPSLGAWVQYGLGSLTDDLPGFVVLNGGLLPTGGAENFQPGFLPARFSPTLFGRTDPPVANVTPAKPATQAERLALVNRLDRGFADAHGRPDAVEGAIKSYELAARLQTAVPDLLDLSREPIAVADDYGLGDGYAHTRTYGRQCLLARRLVQRGCRVVAVTLPRIDADNRWDAHGNLKKNHTDHARTVDKPVAALLRDLKRTGLWADTLVAFTTEFGRTPFGQGKDGRDHNQFGFSVWLAGAGVKGGTVYGATDEYGYKAVENKLLVHDMHATILHLLGLDHEKLTYRFGGRDYRLTDVHGRVVTDILA